MSLINDLDKTLSPSEFSHQMQKMVSEAGFDWSNAKAVLQALKEEVAELEEAIDEKHSLNEIHHELGDIVFTCVNLARHLGTHIDNTLTLSNEKFFKRFQLVENLLANDGKNLGELSFDELLVYWQAAKKQLAEKNESPS